MTGIWVCIHVHILIINVQLVPLVRKMWRHWLSSNNVQTDNTVILHMSVLVNLLQRSGLGKIVVLRCSHHDKDCQLVLRPVTCSRNQKRKTLPAHQYTVAANKDIQKSYKKFLEKKCGSMVHYVLVYMYLSNGIDDYNKITQLLI